jgi:hypothetical protein
MQNLGSVILSDIKTTTYCAGLRSDTKCGRVILISEISTLFLLIIGFLKAMQI